MTIPAVLTWHVTVPVENKHLLSSVRVTRTLVSLQVGYHIEDKVYDTLTVTCSAETYDNNTRPQYLHSTSTTEPALLKLDQGSAYISPSNSTVYSPYFQVGDNDTACPIHRYRMFFFIISQLFWKSSCLWAHWTAVLTLDVANGQSMENDPVFTPSVDTPYLYEYVVDASVCKSMVHVMSVTGGG